MARFLKLDRMEIHGFKSFYARTRFDFPEGITAVVGPNGCGKSNIGDAISWVLGEQKASSLRSDRMEDVIFNGSQGRKPLGMAEVSLIFRNVMPPKSDTACGTIDPEGLGDAHAILNASDGNGNGNGNGNGHGGVVVAQVIEAALADETPVAVVAADAAVAAAEPAAVESPAPGEAATADAATVAGDAAGTDAGEEPRQGGRFFLEDLPEEVVVTRRLYRSGESEYAVNGERCRLRDVQDLLARTEIGTRLYTTIEQGKIDQILLAKPKERRLIIEEAAGILGYKTKRRQTEQKLEATQANLLRLADITSEVDKQIQSLRRQAAKARRYRRLMETVRAARAVVAWRRLQLCDAGLEETRVAVDDLAAREAAAAADLARVEADLESLRQKLDAAEEGARQKRDAVHALDLEIDRLKGRIATGEEQARDLAERRDGADRELAGLAERAAAMETRREVLTADLGAEAEGVRGSEATLALIESDRAARAAAIAADEAALEALRAALVDRVEVLAEIGRRRVAIEEQGKSAEAALVRLQNEAAEAESTLQALGAAVADLREAAASGRAGLEARAAESAAASGTAKQVADELAALERRLEELRGRGAALAERQEALERLERAHPGPGPGVAEILTGGFGFAPRGIVGERLDVPAGLERAVAAVLGPLQEGVLVASRQDAALGVRHLRARSGGRAAFVVAGGMGTGAWQDPSPRAEAGVMAILGDVVRGAEPEPVLAARLSRAALVADLEAAFSLADRFPGWSFVTAEGDLVESDGVVTGGDGPEIQHGLLVRRAERSDLARQIAAVESERQGLESEVAVRRQASAEAAARAERLAAMVQAGQQDQFQADLVLGGKEGELQRLEGTLPVLRAEAARLLRERVERAQEVETLAAAHEAAERERRDGEAGIKVAAERIAAGRSDLETVQRQAAEAQAAVAAGHQRLAALARERDGVAASLHEVRQRAGQLAAEQSSWTERLQALGADHQSLTTQAAEAATGRAAAAAAEEAALAGLAYDRSLLQAREQAAREGRTTLQTLRESSQEVAIRRARLSSDLDHLTLSCRDDLEMTLEALRAAPPAFDDTRPLEADEAEVAQSRTALDAIGPVNLMAVEQCAELEERFTFLSAQQKDLEEAIDSLRDTIRRINRESRQRFMAAFEAIDATFRTSYTTLFGGGRAELRLLDDQDDVLEAGIEIAAQPPGKRLQSIALLSGGERALTAVALLFALFRYRPSPFCVLDEVDAPLDEANVVRFTNLLRTLADETQFILITHNRKSMEVANLLYGVTMEEPGVSKVLPLRFE